MEEGEGGVEEWWRRSRGGVVEEWRSGGEGVVKEWRGVPPVEYPDELLLAGGAEEVGVGGARVHAVDRNLLLLLVFEQQQLVRLLLPDVHGEDLGEEEGEGSPRGVGGEGGGGRQGGRGGGGREGGGGPRRVGME